MPIPRAPILSRVAKDYVERLTAENGALTPQMMLWIPILLADAAGADTDIVLADKCEIVNVIIQKQNGAGAGNVTTLKTAAGTAITNAMAVAVDNTLTFVGTIDDSVSTIAAGGTLRVTHTRAAGTSNQLILVGVLIRP